MEIILTHYSRSLRTIEPNFICVEDTGTYLRTEILRIGETLDSYFDYYHRSRTHLSLGKDSPEPRSIQPPAMGPVVAVSQVGGLHHRYERRAA